MPIQALPIKVLKGVWRGGDGTARKLLTVCKWQVDRLLPLGKGNDQMVGSSRGGHQVVCAGLIPAKSLLLAGAIGAHKKKV